MVQHNHAPSPITSDQRLEKIDMHFRVFAGPGAGKTHWLIEHMKNVVERSSRLGKVAQIACISYTNVAVDEIINRLGSYSDRVYASTIHSFLYIHVVKPYAFLLRNSDGQQLVNSEEMDGHDEHHPTYQNVTRWLAQVREAGDTGRYFIRQDNQKDVFKYLKKLRWRRDGSTNAWRLSVNSARKPVLGLPSIKKTELYRVYKPNYWKNGIVDHDDILYLACRILEENPELRAFLSAKFPYLFVDEFQDTNPIQTQIVEWLAHTGTYVGVVGDTEQSIYGFQGAKVEDFQNFTLNGTVIDFVIQGNRRSTKSIVRVLNAARSDSLQQEALRDTDGTPPSVHVGEITGLIAEITKYHHGEVMLLTHEIKTLPILRNPQLEINPEIESEFDEADSEFGRRRFLVQLATAFVFLQEQSFTKAYKALTVGIPRKIRKPFAHASNPQLTQVEHSALIVQLLEYCTEQYAHLLTLTIADVYAMMRSKIGEIIQDLSMTAYTSGRGAAFAQSHGFLELISAITPSDEIRTARTIHKAKSQEFDHVVLVLPEKNDIHPLIKENGRSNDEDKRRLYVAMSRARETLYLVIPELDASHESTLKKMGFLVKNSSTPKQLPLLE